MSIVSVQEEIHDLLLEGNEQQPNITLREMPNGSMCIAGAREIEVDLSAGANKSLEFVMSIQLRGSMSRATSMTMMNARSSRSHAVFSLMLEQRKGGATSGAGGESQEEDGADSGAEAKETDLSYLCAKMLLVDLAGSERAKRTQATGARLQEGIHINQGAAALPLCCCGSVLANVQALHAWMCFSSVPLRHVHNAII